MPVKFHADHIIDDEGRRWALECPWPQEGEPIPSFLRRHEGEVRPAWPSRPSEPQTSAPRIATQAETPEGRLRFLKRQRRKLRSEIREWEQRLAAMSKGNVDPSDVERARKALQARKFDLLEFNRKNKL